MFQTLVIETAVRGIRDELERAAANTQGLAMLFEDGRTRELLMELSSQMTTLSLELKKIEKEL
ncbi:hypothetical protein [Campylobacter rectus]|uniref:hypothetical protein n=1 Tax=Campylobacter rectus TaxID=203 RepID=UPI00163B5736|nr:hypothetical protein [Campylobacter rectus]